VGRIDEDDEVYRTGGEKFKAIVGEFAAIATRFREPT
jgi:preprotein translocase subunit SecA